MATFGQLFEAFGLLSFQDLVTLATTPTQVFASHDDVNDAENFSKMSIFDQYFLTKIPCHRGREQLPKD